MTDKHMQRRKYMFIRLPAKTFMDNTPATLRFYAYNYTSTTNQPMRHFSDFENYYYNIA